MSKGPEGTFIRSVHKLLPESVYSMKNHNPYNGGIADCWYSGPRADLWVEYKFITIPVRPTTIVDVGKLLSQLQIEWLGDRYVEGRRVAVIVGSKNGGVMFERRMWEVPIPAGAFLAALESRKQLAERICSVVD